MIFNLLGDRSGVVKTYSNFPGMEDFHFFICNFLDNSYNLLSKSCVFFVISFVILTSGRSDDSLLKFERTCSLNLLEIQV